MTGLPALLQVLLIGLKLTGYISWSWWLVLLPLWLSFGIGLLVLILWGAVLIFATTSHKPKRWY